MSPTITTDYRSVRNYRVGDLFTIEGVEIGRVEEIEGDFFGEVRMHLIPNLLYWAKALAFRGRLEGKPRHLTSEQMPSHDPPVAWMVEDHPLARLGFPVIACPAYRHPEPVVEGAATYMDPQPVILPAEPGRRP